MAETTNLFALLDADGSDDLSKMAAKPVIKAEASPAAKAAAPAGEPHIMQTEQQVQLWHASCRGPQQAAAAAL
jgi:hypothetical protein